MSDDFLSFRTKTAKAAKQLNTIRRWVVTGTPIQNNLLELWSLVHWLEFDLYADSMIDFKVAIERPCKVRTNACRLFILSKT